MYDKLRLGLIAPKHSLSDGNRLLGYLKNADACMYQRGEHYDLVWFLNVTRELEVIKKHSKARAFVVGIESKCGYPLNYNAELLRLADYYMGYRDFAGIEFRGAYEKFCFPIRPKDVILEEFPKSLKSKRDYTFCLFATHDPNIRREIGESIRREKSILAGPLFGNRVPEKIEVQRQCRYEFITENDINNYYCSEKIGQALLAGCVPIYYGCKKIKEHIPSQLFIDMSDFQNASGKPDIGAIMSFCLKPGVYERYYQAISKHAFDVIENYTLERCIIEPIQKYINNLIEDCYSNHWVSNQWKLWHIENSIKKHAVIEVIKEAILSNKKTRHLCKLNMLFIKKICQLMLNKPV